MLRIMVRAPVRPTEDPARVRQAVLKMFPGAVLQETEEWVHAREVTLDRLRELIRNMQIPDSARGAMLQNLSRDGRMTWFLLGKQAAAVGRAHFGPLRSPLGDIEVVLESDADGEVERAVYRAAPDTTVDPEWAEIPASQREIV